MYYFSAQFELGRENRSLSRLSLSFFSAICQLGVDVYLFYGDKPKMFQWTRRILFWQSRWKFFAESPKISRSKCEKFRYFFSKKYFSPKTFLCTHIMQFAEDVSLKSEIFLLKVQKIVKWFFWNCFSKTFWTRRMRFWQSCKNFIGQRPRMFCSKSEKFVKLYFTSDFSPKCSTGHD